MTKVIEVNGHTITTQMRHNGRICESCDHLWLAYRNALQRAFINGNQKMIVSRTTDNSTSAANYLNDDSLRDHAEMWKVGGNLSTMWHPYIHDGEPTQAEAMRTIARAGVITVYTRRGVGLRGPNHEEMEATIGPPSRDWYFPGHAIPIIFSRNGKPTEIRWDYELPPVPIGLTDCEKWVDPVTADEEFMALLSG